MASSRDIQRRIKSVSNIGKVTRAMEAVSASKMRRAQAATLASRAYAAKAAEIMAHLRAQPGATDVLHPLLQDRSTGRPAVVLITPDRGLTGGLVLNVVRFAVREAGAVGAETAWVCVGRQGRNFVLRYLNGLFAEFTRIPDAPSVLDVTPLARLLIDGFLGVDLSSVYLVYAEFRSVAKQEPVMYRLLPIEVPPSVEPLASAYAFEPSPETILGEILERLLQLRLYQALLEAQASEHSARMMAMRNATDAAADLAADLALSLNKARQGDITAELLDITGGAEALRGAMAD
jgi:F-type H+-transporting ATPase subunit gamma